MAVFRRLNPAPRLSQGGRFAGRLSERAELLAGLFVGIVLAVLVAGGRSFSWGTFDLQVGPSELVAVSGKSGCGQSTMINMITEIDQSVAALRSRRRT